MGSDINTTLRASVRALLADTGTTFSDAIVDGAIKEAVSDISRLAPRELVHVVVLHSRTVTDEQFTSDHDAWVTLGNKPIDMQQGVTVTSSPAGTTYTEDTDYIIDYAQGRVQVLSTGSMADSTTFLIDYEKSLRGLDLSSLTDFIGIDRVEVAKAGGKDYQEYTSYWQWGDILWLQARNETQANLVENDHVRVWYKAEHTKPGAAAGSYPAYLDDVVVKGAVAYALFSKHRERNLQAITDLATARTALAVADNDQGAIDTLEAAVTTALDSAKTALAAATTSINAADAITDTPLADANTALDAAITSAAAGTTKLGVAAFTNVDAAILASLDAMKTSLALVDGLADTPLADAETALDALITQLSGSTNEVEVLLDSATFAGFNTSIEAALDESKSILREAGGAVEGALDKVVQHLETDTTDPDSAENQLKAGDALINATNLGSDAAGLYAKYGEVQIGIARGFVDEAQMRIVQARGLVEEASARSRQKELYLGEVDRRISVAGTFVSEARERLGIGGLIARAAEGYSLEAAQRVAHMRVGIDEVGARISVAGSYVVEARERLGIANSVVQAGMAHVASAEGYINEAAGRFQQIDRHIQLGNLYLSQARLYQEGSDRENQSADRFLIDAQERHLDYWEHLRSRVEMSWPNQRATAVKQHPARQNP
tara:strand:- start:10168 stop:12162 length:1995 start_codon:yes stop_codon:yes gene_type:complete